MVLFSQAVGVFTQADRQVLVQLSGLLMAISSPPPAQSPTCAGGVGEAAGSIIWSGDVLCAQ